MFYAFLSGPLLIRAFDWISAGANSYLDGLGGMCIKTGNYLSFETDKKKKKSRLYCYVNAVFMFLELGGRLRGEQPSQSGE